ncbi:MAG: stage II sporulation protein P [Ruminococcus sp.]|nr:stage II sporulation protein P [Ruminococcus sp.]MDE6784585.1 stage II sporulation protein P [Ruminococcus sp.]
MTRYKRRKIAAAVKWTALLLLPVIAVGTAKGMEFLKTKAENRNDTVQCSSVESRKMKKKNGKSDILSGEAILSHGYGIYAEVSDTDVRLQNPIDMVSDNPGDKPYPTEWTAGIEITRTTYGEYSGTTYFNLDNGGQVNNRSSISNDDLLAESRILPDFTISDTDEPQVLIYHTHTTESFEPFVRDNLDAVFNYRTTDSTKNMIMVGNAIQAELEAAGIGVIHVVEIHDYPSYNGSYERSRESIVPILEQYPTIKVALDIHRDAISNETFAAQPYVEIDGKEAAQIMIISGCDDGTLNMPDYLKNFHFASHLQQQLESDYSGFTRPILFDYRHYNQDLTTGSLLIEVGSHGNTLEQVQYSGQLIGRSLSRLLESMKGK